MANTSDSDNDKRPAEQVAAPSRLCLIGGYLAYIVAWCIVGPVEWQRIQGLSEQNLPFGTWFFTANIDTTFPCFALITLPLFYCLRWSFLQTRFVGKYFGSETRPAGREDQWAGLFAWSLAIAVAGISLLASNHVAQSEIGIAAGQTKSFGKLPPAYHDEYSYLFQAETYLEGRLAFASHKDVPELFDQMHVVNEGTFASRYFPGVGAWIAPFLSMGHPVWGHWLAGALTAFFMFWIGRELGGIGVGLISGVLTALSPGMMLFSNLLLSHHPTLAGLSLFAFTFLRMLRTHRYRYAICAGVGLAYAMLCRPMTAASFGLPFGICFVSWIFLPRLAWSMRQRLGYLLAMGIPLLFGFGILAVTNKAITDRYLVTPYELYTNTYTPRHVYGFNNRVRGEQHLGPRVIEGYDKWAQNLTPELATENVKNRLIASCQWTLGIVLLAMTTVVFFFVVPRGDRRWWLIPAAILSLHVAHVPYWFVGIMHWHYVFETGPLWLVMFAGCSACLVSRWYADRRYGMPLWLGLLTLATILPTYVPLSPWWETTRLEAAISEIAYPRQKYERFQQFTQRSSNGQPLLVLVEHDDADVSMDYVNNRPSLTGNILIGRYVSGKTEMSKVRASFPDRQILLIRAAQLR